MLLFWVNVFGFSERYMVEESLEKWGDHGDNFMRYYVERNALFLVKVRVFHLQLSNVGLGDCKAL